MLKYLRLFPHGGEVKRCKTNRKKKNYKKERDTAHGRALRIFTYGSPTSFKALILQFCKEFSTKQYTKNTKNKTNGRVLWRSKAERYQQR
ncbi:hypothetical protein FS559_02295 [Treponema phagedenis]|nr:hypothetical protein FS559_02295 [Treponema phagedenis]